MEGGGGEREKNVVGFQVDRLTTGHRDWRPDAVASVLLTVRELGREPINAAA